VIAGRGRQKGAHNIEGAGSLDFGIFVSRITLVFVWLGDHPNQNHWVKQSSKPECEHAAKVASL